jgi:hypothetical protein
MGSTEFSEDDLFQLDSPSGDSNATEVIELEESNVIDPSWTGLRCDKCAAPLRSKEMTVCQNCGWYASLGTFVELDREWENATSPENTDQPKPKQSHLQVWMNLLPWYGWLSIASVTAVLVESLVIRLTFAENELYTTVSLAQLAIGAIAFGLCHILHFMGLASDDSDTGLLDFAMRPLKTWMYAGRQLPRKLYFFLAGLMGLAAVIGSLAIIGGIPYERLLDWGVKERPKPNLMGAVMEQAAKNAGDSDMTMEEAVEELAGKAGVDDLDLDDKDEKKPVPAADARKNIDCVILGFRANEDRTITALILGAEHRGRLRYAGRVEPVLDEDDNAELFKQLVVARTRTPLLPMQITANWVIPAYACRVTHTGRSGDGRLEEIEWGKLLGEIKFK